MHGFVNFTERLHERLDRGFHDGEFVFRKFFFLSQLCNRFESMADFVKGIVGFVRVVGGERITDGVSQF